jgi:hypothetical protein
MSFNRLDKSADENAIDDFTYGPQTAEELLRALTVLQPL